jgi:hypothetical protein
MTLHHAGVTASADTGFDPASVDVTALERRFRRALAEGHPGDLPVVGYGEISLAFGWPPEDPSTVVKSLPVFDDLGRLLAYADLVEEYVDALTDRGVDVVPSAVRGARVPGGWRGYLLQPRLPPTTLAPTVLSSAGPSADEVLERVVDRVTATVDTHVGLDAQLSNWALVDGRLRYLDVGTPMLRDDGGRDRLDIAVLATSMPWVLRGFVSHVVGPGILTPYHDPHLALLDAAGNLIRERLEAWLPRFLAVANRQLEHPLCEAQVRRFYRWNARLYTTLQALRRADRAWQLRVRHRPYPFLLPEHYER